METSTYRENAHANKVMSDGVRALNADGRYANLSLEAKFLYALMLDRVRLSERNGWRDEDGRTFICFSAKDAARLLGASESKARRVFRELESPGLVRREKQGQGRPDRLYVRTFD
jgi:hypothetical protein